MNVSFILNGEDVYIRVDARARLVDVLRGDFGLTGTKACCRAGKCGLCAVIFNGSVINSCLVPAFRLRNGEVITIEGFSLTEEHGDIARGFAEAGLENCGYCQTGKTLAAASLLGGRKRPSRDEILRVADGAKCRCMDPGKFAEGIEKALEAKTRRLHGGSD